jgi:hypothetical protein
MENLSFKKIKRNSGAAMLIFVVFFLFISLAIISGLVSPSVREFRNAAVNLNSKQSYFLAESGSEDAMYRILKSMTIGSSETITLGSNSETTAITSPTGYSKQITSLGNVSSFQRKTSLSLQAGAGVAFNYGLQSGTGGIKIDSGTINGNIYANGNIDAKDGIITGTAVAAGTGSTAGRAGNNYYALKVGQNGAGDVWASNVVSASAAGHMYCLTQGSYVNKPCDTSKGVPPLQPLPFTDQNITDWKNAAVVGGTITGATKCPGGYSGGNCTVDWHNATFGPGKITGNLTVNGGGTLTLTGTIWVVGTVTINGDGKIQLPTSYGKNSETIVSDNLVDIEGGGSLGSGNSSSYLFIVSTSASANAISVTGGAGAIAVDAQNGTVNIFGGATLDSAVGNSMIMSGGSTVTYNSGLASPSFSDGPAGSWIVGSWGEGQ